MHILECRIVEWSAGVGIYNVECVLLIVECGVTRVDCSVVKRNQWGVRSGKNWNMEWIIIRCWWQKYIHTSLCKPSVFAGVVVSLCTH